MGLFVTPALLDFHSKKHPVVWFGSSPTPFSPSPVSKLSICLNLPASRRSSLLTGKGVGEEPNRTTAKSLVLYKSFNTLCQTFDQRIRVRTPIQTSPRRKKAKI
jgi:hypothetical protein